MSSVNPDREHNHNNTQVARDRLVQHVHWLSQAAEAVEKVRQDATKAQDKVEAAREELKKQAECCLAKEENLDAYRAIVAGLHEFAKAQTSLIDGAAGLHRRLTQLLQADD